jgi:hypothetical protein
MHGHGGVKVGLGRPHLHGDAGKLDHLAGVSQAVSETGAAATQVLSSAESLAGQAGRLREEMGKFLATVRAA